MGVGGLGWCPHQLKHHNLTLLCMNGIRQGLGICFVIGGVRAWREICGVVPQVIGMQSSRCCCLSLIFASLVWYPPYGTCRLMFGIMLLIMHHELALKQLLCSLCFYMRGTTQCGVCNLLCSTVCIMRRLWLCTSRT